MHELVLLGGFRRVRFRRKTSEALLVDVDSQGLIACDHDVNAEVELVRVDQQGVADVPRDHGHLIVVEVIQVVYNVDSATSR